MKQRQHKKAVQREKEMNLSKKDLRSRRWKIIKSLKSLRKYLEIIRDYGDDVTVDATPLSYRSPTIVDYKIYKEGKKSYIKIFKADVEVSTANAS
nr:hypothetical protein [Tanacetum cinerariifolium]